MTKPLLLILLAPIGLAYGADPDIQRALDDALKRFPPGDYKNVIPPLLPQKVEVTVAERFKPAERAHPPGTLPWLHQEVNRLNGTIPELPATNPFANPLELFRAPASPTPAR